MAIYNLTTGVDHFDASSTGTANDEFRATPDTINAGDYIDGYAGNNQFRLQSVGTFDLRVMDPILNIADFYLESDNSTLYNRDGQNVSLHALGAGDVVYGGSGAEVIDFFSASSEIHGGDGDDTFVVRSLAYLGSSLKLDGGGGNDFLRFVVSGTVNLAAVSLLTSFKDILLGTGNDVLVVNQAIVDSGATIDGSGGINEIQAAGTSINLTGASLQNFSKVSTNNTTGTEFFLSTSNPFSSIAGFSGDDTFHAVVGQFGTSVTFDGGAGTDTFSLDSPGVYDLTALAGFTGIEKITSTSGNNTLIVNDTILGSLTSIDLGTGSNLLQSASTTIDLTGKVLGHIQAVEGTSAGTTFTIDDTQLAAGGGTIATITATGTGNTLSTAGATLNTTGLTLANIQQFATTSTTGTSFTLASGPSNITVTGGTGNDTVHAVVGQFDATDSLAGGAGADTFSLDGSGAYDLTAIGSFTGFEKIASTSGNNTLTVDATILAALTSIDLGTGSNTLRSGSSTIDLTAKTLAHVQTLEATQAGTTVTVDNAQLSASGGSIAVITATGAGNTLSTTGTAFDATGVTLTNIQQLATTNASGTSFTLASGLSNITVTGGSGNDTVHTVVGQFDATDNLNGGAGADTFSLDGSGAYDLTAMGGFTGFETIVSTSGNNTLTVDATILTALTSIDLGAGSNTLKSGSSTIDLTAKTLAHVQTLEATQAGTAFTLDNAELVAGGGLLSAITGAGTGNSLSAAGSTLDVTGVTLTNIQTLKAANGVATTLVDNADAHALIGGAGADILTGGGGADQLTGGAGADTFRDTAAHLNGATITDLAAADTIDLTDIALSGATVSFAAGMLTVKSAAATVAEIALTGSYDNNFSLVSDGASGLSITYGGALSAPSGPSGPSGPAIGAPTFGSVLRLSADGSGLPLVGTRGNDSFTGSSDPAKIDTVMENGTKFSENTITRQTDGSLDIVGPNGHDHLTGVERILFDDGVLILNLPSAANTMTALYRVMFDRTPDEAGIKWQINTFDSGASLDKIANIFLTSDEAAFIRLPNLSNADFISQLYDNAFDRKPEAGGLQYWAEALDHGASRESVALFFVQSHEEVDLVGQANKIGVFSAYPQAGL